MDLNTIERSLSRVDLSTVQKIRISSPSCVISHPVVERRNRRSRSVVRDRYLEKARWYLEAPDKPSRRNRNPGEIGSARKKEHAKRLADAYLGISNYTRWSGNGRPSFIASIARLSSIEGRMCVVAGIGRARCRGDETHPATRRITRVRLFPPAY